MLASTNGNLIYVSPNLIKVLGCFLIKVFGYSSLIFMFSMDTAIAL